MTDQPADCQCLPASPTAPRIYCDDCRRASQPPTEQSQP